nr:MAG TPA: hypothetical protein [Caudoviricetes sp.]
MTTKEKIKIMQAYERGEEIEMRLADCEDIWVPAISPLWNWEKLKYRIKPKEKRGLKFKVGDVLVHLEKEGQPLYWGDIYRVVSIDEKYTAEEAGYQYKGAYEYFEKIFIKADDVLWYWEYQDVDGEWKKTNARYTKSGLSKEVLGPNERETAMPLYALGFRLPREKDKE